MPAYVVFSDATLQSIAETRPVTRAQLAGVPGVGAVKLDRYGAAVLELCAELASRDTQAVGPEPTPARVTGGSQAQADPLVGARTRTSS